MPKTVSPGTIPSNNGLHQEGSRSSVKWYFLGMGLVEEIEAMAALARELHGYGYALPKPITPEWLEEAVSKGMVPKSDLQDCSYYVGLCRNAPVAKWDARGGCFWYLRTKFGDTFAEKINHPEDANGFDVFVPTMRLT